METARTAMRLKNLVLGLNNEQVFGLIARILLEQDRRAHAHFTCI